MKNQIDTVTTINRIRENAKAMPEVRVIREMKIGQVVRQGDIYIERVKEIEGKGKAVKSRQLAPGNTKGSRHIVDESPSVKIWESSPALGSRARFQVGPAIEAVGDFAVSHPEHAWVRFALGVKAAFQVWFQADFARKERARD